MNLTLEIPQLALDRIPIGYQKRLAERAILQIYEEGYISQDEFSQICQKEFYQFTSSVSQKAITTELYQNRKKYFSEMKGGTGEWEDILQNIVSTEAQIFGYFAGTVWATTRDCPYDSPTNVGAIPCGCR